MTNNGDVILEVGANVGTETVSYADIVGPDGIVHAFEPVPSNVSRYWFDYPQGLACISYSEAV